jgi:nitrogen fixation protein NifB
VVSELLTPEQAVHKVMAVAAAIPQLSVVGIAGPGDPLANPERTFATLEQISTQAPELALCVSTNGLRLPEYVDALCRYNVGHVTITINCLDPAIGTQLYPWIFWNHRRIKGRKGVEILLEQQQEGLAKLVAHGVLVKVNSVLVPGVNDQHIPEISRFVKAQGAFLHNIMPLIAAPAYGSFYGVMGQRGPTQVELERLQEACAGDMRMMRHCRQCRADAVGMLGEDRQAEFTQDKIAEQIVHQGADYPQAMARRRQVQIRIEDIREAHEQWHSRSSKAA